MRTTHLVALLFVSSLNFAGSENLATSGDTDVSPGSATSAPTDLFHTCIHNFLKTKNAPKKNEPIEPFRSVKQDPEKLPSAKCAPSDPKYFENLKTALNRQTGICSAGPICQTNQLLSCLANKSNGFQDFMATVKSNFDFNKSTGRKTPMENTDVKAGDFEFTAYGSPFIKARKPPCGSAFPWPLHKAPANLVRAGKNVSCGIDPVSGRPAVRCLDNGGGSFSQAETITSKASSVDDADTVACVPSQLDALQLGVEGSGALDFGDGKPFYINFGGYNGKLSVPASILVRCDEWKGDYLKKDGNIVRNANGDPEMDFSKVPRDDYMGDSKVRNYLKKKFGNNTNALNKFLANNTNEIYFKMNNVQPTGSAGFPVTSLASMATDNSMLPIGTVALIETPSPGYLKPKDPSCNGKMTFLSIAQDKGSAIGGTHSDIYAGFGKNGESMADDYIHGGSLSTLAINAKGNATLLQCSPDSDSGAPPKGEKI